MQYCNSETSPRRALSKWLRMFDFHEHTAACASLTKSLKSRRLQNSINQTCASTQIHVKCLPLTSSTCWPSKY